jgi:F-type H+-transporting ATPase subunit epsilon
MKLEVRTPTGMVLDENEGRRVAAETVDGAFTVKPRHLDFVTTLVPGILACTVAGEELLLAVDRGVLVKAGAEVTVSVRDAVRGDSIENLEQTVREHLERRGEHERRAFSALARLESNLVRSFVDFGWGENG